MEPVTDIRLLWALLAPLFGAGLVMLTGRRSNLREACSLLSAITLFALVASMLPDIRAGRTLSYVLFPLLPGLSFSLRADPLSMIFAVTASFLWILTIFYSAGYMRGLKQHAQTRLTAKLRNALALLRRAESHRFVMGRDVERNVETLLAFLARHAVSPPAG